MTQAERVSALQTLGYSEIDAAFLSLVAVHAGYFLRRQYEVFARVARGRPSSRFLSQAVSGGHARSIEYANRTVVYHLFARPVYRAIGEEDNRNRRLRPNFSIKAKLMALDFVLANRHRRLLGTESEKTEHFCGRLRIDESRLPGKTYTSRQRRGQTRRYFVEKYPILLAPANGSESAEVTSFCYVDEGVLSTSGFTSFLKRYRSLFVALRHFHLAYVAAQYKPLRSAERAFYRVAESLANPESWRPKGAMGEYFVLRRLLEIREYSQLDKAKLDRLRDFSRRFRHPRTEAAYQSWADEMTAAEQLGPVQAHFEFHQLPHRYDIFSFPTEPQSGA